MLVMMCSLWCTARQCMLDAGNPDRSLLNTDAGITSALREALRSESRAIAEATVWKQKAQRWQERCEQQEQLVALLRSQSNLCASSIKEGESNSPAEPVFDGFVQRSAFSHDAALPRALSPPVRRTVLPTATSP